MSHQRYGRALLWLHCFRIAYGSFEAPQQLPCSMDPLDSVPADSSNQTRQKQTEQINSLPLWCSTEADYSAIHPDQSNNSPRIDIATHTRWSWWSARVSNPHAKCSSKHCPLNRCSGGRPMSHIWPSVARVDNGVQPICVCGNVLGEKYIQLVSQSIEINIIQ